jgi:hypothetical protein
VVENGSTHAEAGEDPKPDLTFETSWAQWIEISMRGESPARAVLQRRLRPRGSVRGLRAFTKLFAPRNVT